MSAPPTDRRLELWHALGQIVPHMESPDTLGTAIATALSKMVGAGRTAVILPGRPLEARSPGEPSATSYYLRLVGEEMTPSHPIYLDGEKGILAQLPNLQEPLTLNAPWPAEYARDDDALLQLARQSLTLVPVPGAGRAATPASSAALCLLDLPSAKVPTPVELASLASFASLALCLVESKAQAARQAVEYKIISKIGRSLTSSLSLDDIFQQILFSVRSAIGASAISVGLIDLQTEEVVLEKSLMGPEFNALPPVRLKLGQGVAGWVAKTGRPLNAHDAYKNPHFFPGVDLASGFTTHSILCVPLVVEGEVIGVMEAMNKSSGQFDDSDERLLSALGSSAAIAIQKARWHADVLAEKGRMEALFATMSEGLLTTRLNGQITTVNPALQTMIGAEESELLGRYCYEAIRTEPNTLGGLVDQMQEKKTERETFQAACDVIRPDGARAPVLISGAATFDSGGEVTEIVIVLSDIGQIRELERMQDDFVANVTHELRTPLATILLYARLLRAGKTKGDPEREARYLETIEQQSNHIQKLVRQILDLSRMEATVAYSRQDRVHLPKILNELLDSFSKIAQQKGLTVKVHVPADLPAVTSNREALRLIFRNLIDNAIKFTQRGEIEIRLALCEEGVQVDVSDQGIGITPESLPHLFQRFYRSKAAVELGIGGTGLGLALVKETVEKLGGQIRVQSWPGRGSAFSVVLPVEMEPDTAA